MKMVVCIVATAVVLLWAPAPSKAQDAVQSPGKILTPFGYQDAANVHRVPEGYALVRMADGHVRAENPTTGSCIDYAIPAPNGEQSLSESVLATNSNWITYASWQNQTGTPTSYFSATWKVPPAPKSYMGQYIYLFNTLQSGADYTSDTGLRPVLAYIQPVAGGPKYWAASVWYLTNRGIWQSPEVEVKPGQTLTGEFTLIGETKKGTFNYACDFKGLSEATISIYHVPELVWCAEVLETFYINECNQYPDIAFTQMSGIKVRTGTTTPPVTWTPTTLQFDCGTQTTIVKDGGEDGIVHIYY
jgi:hypothetical protein